MELTQLNMLTQQIRACYVTDERVLWALENTPREQFAPSSHASWAYFDCEIPLDHHEKMWTPQLEGEVLQALSIQPHEVVLELGTGSGYLTAVLAQLSARVVSVDLYPDFVASVEKKLARHGLHQVELKVGDASRDWVSNHPYDVIVITGAMATPPKTYLDQLNVGGRLFVIYGNAPSMTASCFTRVQERVWNEKKLFETVIRYLVHAEPETKFLF